MKCDMALPITLSFLLKQHFQCGGNEFFSVVVNFKVILTYLHKKNSKLLNSLSRNLVILSWEVTKQFVPTTQFMIIIMIIIGRIRINQLVTKSSQAYQSMSQHLFLAPLRGQNIIWIFSNIRVSTSQKSMMGCLNWQPLPKIEVFYRPE